MKLKFFTRFAIAGFLIGAILCVYTFYNNLAHHGPINTTLFLILCPPSIGAIALDSAGVAGGIMGWLVISFLNGGLYGLGGLLLDFQLRKKTK
jgi:hypothetical protein